MFDLMRRLRGLVIAPDKEAIIQHFRHGQFVGQTDISMKRGRFIGRFYTKDVFDPMAFQFRMSAGFAGSVTRTNPVQIEPVLVNPAAPPLGFGYAVMVDPTSQGVRQMASGDVSTSGDIYGVVVRSFPGQDPGSAGAYGASGFGQGTPPITGALDILRMGYIMVPVNGVTVKGQQAHVWCTANSGAHKQGVFEASQTASNTLDIASTKTTYNGPADANGNVELAFNI